MAAIAKSGTPSLSTPVPGPEHRIAGLIAGAAIAAGDPCYIKSTDGMVYPSDGAAANAAAKVRGYAPVAAQAGEAVTLLHGVHFRYGSGLQPGTDVYLAAGGGLADAPSTGGVAAIGHTLDATRILLKQSSY